MHAHPFVLESIREDIFNDRIWPDFVRLSNPDSPYLRMEELAPEKTVEAEGMRITHVIVDHVVRPFGLGVEDGRSTVVFGGDSGPTSRLWEVARRSPNLEAVYLECTFPDSMSELAEVSAHLTPATFREEVGKLPKSTRVFAVHIKPRYRDEVVEELTALELPNLVIGRSGEEYAFGEREPRAEARRVTG